jgi:hypothetical protein
MPNKSKSKKGGINQFKKQLAAAIASLKFSLVKEDWKSALMLPWYMIIPLQQVDNCN